MSLYCLVENGLARQYTFSDFKRDNPGVDFPLPVDLDWLAEQSIFPVTRTQQPDNYDRETHRLDGYTIVADGDGWLQEWQIVPRDAEDIALREKLRKRRDNREQVKQDTFITALADRTPAQIGAYVDANLNNIEDAKVIVTKALVALSVLLSDAETLE